MESLFEPNMDVSRYEGAAQYDLDGDGIISAEELEAASQVIAE